jgi:hypothetical protein
MSALPVAVFEANSFVADDTSPALSLVKPEPAPEARLPWRSVGAEAVVVADGVTLAGTSEKGAGAAFTIWLRKPDHGIQTTPDVATFVRSTILGKDRSWTLRNVGAVDKDTVSVTFDTLKEHARVLPFASEIVAWIAKNPTLVTEARERSVAAYREYRVAQREAHEATLRGVAANVVARIVRTHREDARKNVNAAARIAELNAEIEDNARLLVADRLGLYTARDFVEIADAEDASKLDALINDALEGLATSAEPLPSDFF